MRCVVCTACITPSVAKTCSTSLSYIYSRHTVLAHLIMTSLLRTTVSAHAQQPAILTAAAAVCTDMLQTSTLHDNREQQHQ
jgi:hypothetical protein